MLRLPLAGKAAGAAKLCSSYHWMCVVNQQSDGTSSAEESLREQQQQPQTGRSGEGAASVLDHIRRHERAKADNDHRPDSSFNSTRLLTVTSRDQG